MARPHEQRDQSHAVSVALFVRQRNRRPGGRTVELFPWGPGLDRGSTGHGVLPDRGHGDTLVCRRPSSACAKSKTVRRSGARRVEAVGGTNRGTLQTAKGRSVWSGSEEARRQGAIKKPDHVSSSPHCDGEGFILGTFIEVITDPDVRAPTSILSVSVPRRRHNHRGESRWATHPDMPKSVPEVKQRR